MPHANTASDGLKQDLVMDKVLVLGATGYVGTRLVSRLLDEGYQVRATSRTLGKIQGRRWAKHPKVELVEVDLLDYNSASKVLAGCSHAFYLVHSMNSSSRDFAESDRQAARNFVKAANQSQLRQLIYLSGLGEDSPDLSNHLRSRAEVSNILKTAQVPVTTLRAAMIIGSGSASFEILRYLVDRLPIMVTPRWVSVPTQPIAISNVLTYLTGCLKVENTKGGCFDIGGPEVVTYRQLMEIYADEAGLEKRFVVPVPVFTPKLSSYWIHLVTPVPAYIGRPLAEGLRNPTVCQNDEIVKLIPQRLYTCREATRLALDKLQHHQVESHWTDAGKIWPVAWSSQEDEHWAGGTVYYDTRRVIVQATPEEVWTPIIRIGGKTGYYYADWLWRLRGIVDKLIGGVGTRRGRRDPANVSVGDALDFWRVKDVAPEEHLVLVAEMKLPGEAVLEFKVRPVNDKETEIVQTAKFLPKGLLGILYWKLVTPLHNLVFEGMLRGIVQACGKPMRSPILVSNKQAKSKSAAMRPIASI